jgi:hypothetical protein
MFCGWVFIGLLALGLLIVIVTWLHGWYEKLDHYQHCKRDEASFATATARIAELEAELELVRMGGPYRQAGLSGSADSR